MAPDDIPFANPASETEGMPKSGHPPIGSIGPGRSIGPESETRGGPEASDECPEITGRTGNVSGKATSQSTASDPPEPPGQTPEIPAPGPDRSSPIEVPPHPLPVPPNDPPPPIVALSGANTMRCG
jgi:hypothetical protein